LSKADEPEYKNEA